MDDIYDRLTSIFHEVFEGDSTVAIPELTVAKVPGWAA
jgi:hypothetical protein